jgi:hypothetical protein
MLRSLALTVAWTLAFASHASAADSYPRTGAVLYSNPQSYWDNNYGSVEF